MPNRSAPKNGNTQNSRSENRTLVTALRGIGKFVRLDESWIDRLSKWPVQWLQIEAEPVLQSVEHLA